MKCLNAGLFEETLKRFKTQYGHTSRKGGTVTEETLTTLTRRYFSASFDFMRNESRKQKAGNVPVCVSVNIKALVSKRNAVIVVQLREWQQYEFELMQLGSSEHAVSEYVFLFSQ